MIKNGEMNIMFMGGSITYGECSSKYENSWAFRVSEFLKQRLKGYKLNFYNAAISGTGTRFGVFRLNDHILKYDPDLIFIEFAVNDSRDAQKDEDAVISSLEYIIRGLIKHNPFIKIVLLYSAMMDWKACSSVHEKVASNYNIPSIDIQSHVKALIENAGYKWQDIHADNVHPNDLGHKIYVDYIIDMLEKKWDNIMGREYSLNRSLARYPYCFPRIVGIDGIDHPEGWEIRNNDDQNKHIDEIKVRKIIYSKLPGSSLSFRFSGTHFGLYHNVGRDCGICSIKIDDEPETRHDCFYNTEGDYVAFYNRCDLKAGSHVAELVITGERNEKSLGNSIAIAGILVD